MGNSQPFKQLRPHSLHNDASRSGIILGATGATGRYLLSHLLKSPEWGKVKIIHRRKIDFTEIQKHTGYKFTDNQKEKLEQCIINMDNIGDKKYEPEFKDFDTVFCCLGTTRSNAGSAENFKKVDLYMVENSAKNAKNAGVKQYNLLTSMGSNANMWGNEWAIAHPLFYFKVKGLAENAVKACGFDRVSIFRYFVSFFKLFK